MRLRRRKKKRELIIRSIGWEKILVEREKCRPTSMIIPPLSWLGEWSDA